MTPIVDLISRESDETWNLRSESLTDCADEVISLSKRIKESFSTSASDNLVTKTMLGVFGCVPAFDKYFTKGLGCASLCKPALIRIGKFYDDNQSQVDARSINTLDFGSGVDTSRLYPSAKKIDMIFFREGLNMEKAAKAKP